ncbi:WYL domain-containing protein [Paenibacillus faecalis]|uniref:WYL domain-containing protein n=1 Tax=Paenibacillus faecalis TaxID=2079532 RepID=UPI000D0E3BD6|nr:WYL domain-containing protein [Paenibacillus faecalis]
MRMNLFEKIFNYQIMTRLDESDSIAITSQERSWLKTMLAHSEAVHAFTPGTLEHLKELLHLENTSADVQDIILEKTKGYERSIYHPLLRTLRRLIMLERGFRLTYKTKLGDLRSNHSGFPYKLEYSMVKRDWVLIWYSAKRKSLMYTKLFNILYVQETTLPSDRMMEIKGRLANLMDNRKEHAVIEINRKFNRELSRILYAFSCFEKTVSYDEDTDTYHVTVQYPEDERDFLLSRIRFLGLRVKIIEGKVLQKRMQESAMKTLARYEEE